MSKVWIQLSCESGLGQPDGVGPHDRARASGFRYARQVPELRSRIPGDSIPVLWGRHANSTETESGGVLCRVDSLGDLLPLCRCTMTRAYLCQAKEAVL